MKKLLFVLAAASLTLSSCLKEDNSYKRRLPVAPGEQIYERARIQNNIAMQPADVAMRLAILLAEAEKQKDPVSGETPELTKVVVKDVNVYERFFGKPSIGGTKIEKLENGDYKLTFDPKVMDTYYKCKGTMTISTNDTPLLSETAGKPWSLKLDPGFQVLIYMNGGGSNSQSVDLEAMSIELFKNGEVYTIRNRGLVASFTDSKIKSDWSGIFELTPPTGGEGLAYSDVTDKMFTLNGSSSGDTAFTVDGSTSARMEYQVSNGLFKTYYQILGGTETCKLYNGDLSVFPSPDVIYEWSLSDDGKRLTRTIRYNGYEVTDMF